jgi:septal ring factor EnvC (AmiA/AmiB activator)
MYRRYSSSDSEIKAAEARATDLENKLQRTGRELAEKKAALEKNAAALQKQTTTIDTIVPKMLSKTAREAELAELAHAIYQMPGHSVNLPSIPPNSALRRYRIRIEGRPHSYVMVAGLVDGRWVLYSYLLKNQDN